MFDLIEWAERGDKVTALIQAAVEYNNHNEALRQLKQDASEWFAPGGSTDRPKPAKQQLILLCELQPRHHIVLGDIIVANIGGGSENIAVGKNIHQSTDDTKPRERKLNRDS